MTRASGTVSLLVSGRLLSRIPAPLCPPLLVVAWVQCYATGQPLFAVGDQPEGRKACKRDLRPPWRSVFLADYDATAASLSVLEHLLWRLFGGRPCPTAFHGGSSWNPVVTTPPSPKQAIRVEDFDAGAPEAQETFPLHFQQQP